MKDIDFDELDKAVNSLMGGVKSKTDKEEAKTLTITTTLKEGEQPAYDKIQHAAEKIGSETLLGPREKTAVLSGTADEQVTVLNLSSAAIAPVEEKPVVVAPVVAPVVAVQQPAPVVDSAVVAEPLPVAPAPEPVPPLQKMPVAKAPSGRFMDVMHPSSDMKTAATSSAAPAQATPSSHVATAIVVPSRPARAAAVPVPTETPVTATAPVSPIVAVAPPTEVQPLEPVAAPARVTEVAVETVVPPPVVQAVVSQPVEAATVTQELESTDVTPAEIPEPLTSPFLPDAKVEKRPLGGSSEQTDLDASDVSSFDNRYAVDNSADTQLAPTQTEQPAMPAEFHTDLLAIETNIAESDAPGTSVEPVKSSEPTVDATPVNEPDSSLEGSDTPENGAIFDTTDYHKTVAHPAKHKSEWLWIALIIGIVIICGAGAAAFYLLGSQ